MFLFASLDAAVYASIPGHLRYRGEPTEWMRVTRPGVTLHSFLESPLPCPDGSLLVVDVPCGRLLRISSTGAWSVELQYDGEPHGLARLPDGTIAVTDYRNGLLVYDEKTKSIAPLVSTLNSERFRGLGDLTCGPDGTIWFTDPGRTSLSDPTGRLLRLRPGHARPEVILANVPYPNGVALTADGKKVLLAATRANAIWSLLADAPDPVFPMAGVFIQLSGGLGPDGLAVSRQGHLAVAQAQAGRVYLFDAIGDPIAVIRTPGGDWTTAVAFDDQHQRLYITEAQTGSIYVADLSALSLSR